ncbi:MAG: bifunctional UDP-N-acetylglucosamine pyrophosphorylase/glucosamine-1-phosphate N-acetyltransferase [Alphaproteobacteria bacterium]|jgi:bifunctional UDP-N-acetylglucosamine pyrophosphorylase/glucosamine-1-phosphate N-acetyltransferase
MSQTAVIVLAAGKGTRMKSKLPKVLHCVAKRPMLGHVIDAGLGAEPAKTVVVISQNQVAEYVGKAFPHNSICIQQEKQLGTAHAVLAAEAELKNITGNVLILCGDVPLLNRKTIERFIISHETQQHDVTFMSVFAEDPTGLGRVIRDDNDDVLAIVEHKDATDAQKKIDEINTGIYIAKKDVLFDLLHKVDNKNAQGEYYITDIVSLALKYNHLVGTYTAEDAEALSGVNSRLQLACMEDMFQNAKREHYMDNGVTFIDPQSVFFAYDTNIGTDVEIGPNVQFDTGVRVESNVTIEGNGFFKDTHFNEGAFVKSFCHLEGAEVGFQASVGPFTRLRPGATLADNAKAGSFVEIKNSTIGRHSAVGHLTYVGDATVGNHVNFGAGSITANYDGAVKHKTIIGDNVFIGAGSTLVAPVTVHAGATTAANSIITKDVAENTLVVSKVMRTERSDFKRPSKQAKSV